MGNLSQAQQMMIAIAAVFIIGFLMVGSNKEQSSEQKKAASMVRDVANMQRIAHKKCPQLIKKHTGTQQVASIVKSDSDRATYLTLEYTGEEGDNFKKVFCTLSVVKGGISKLIIDGKTVIDEEG
jgi:hypothetical protein